MNTRCRLSLDGKWSFWIDPYKSLNPHSLVADQAVQLTVPAPWQPQSPDLEGYSGAAWYQRTLDIPQDWLEDGALILGIDAADYFTDVWLNGEKIGEHEGGYLPFELDATHAAQPGQNILTIRVDDPPELFAEIPHGKQGWYGPLSGIWQPVWLERRAAGHIRSVKIDTDLDQGCVEALITLSRPVESATTLQVRISGPEGTQAVTGTAVIPDGYQAQVGLNFPNPLAWSPEAPNLYALEIRLVNESGEVDRLSKDFGFRKIEARDGKLYLNGDLLYLRAALDQDYYLDTVCTSPDSDFLEKQVAQAKEMGLNCLRCHIKVADPRYYEIADRLGMLIWTELPNWSTLTEEAGRRGRDTLEGILERDGHHPSIIIWTIINENWGTDLVNDPTHRAWLKDMVHWLKALDPTRLVVDNSPCLPNFHVETDLEDFHFYRAIPDQRKEWDHFVKEFASRPSWTFSPNGDFIRTGREPLIVSEFGSWGLPDVDPLQDSQGRDPWWFGTGFEWSEGVVYPEGIRRRFHSLGLEQLFGSLKKFAEATQWQQYLALKYEIEAMRRQPEICGYVITELTDVHWECNGLLDMNRRPKAYVQELQEFNAETVILPIWERVDYWPGERVEIELEVSHYGSGELPEGDVKWRLSSGLAAGELFVPTIQPGQVTPIGIITFLAPDLSAPAVQRLELELRSANGDLISRNHLDLSFYTCRELPAATLYTVDQGLAARLEMLGYQVTDDLSQANLAVTGMVTPELLTYLRQGGRLLILADRVEKKTQLLPGIRVEARQGSSWMGDWASAFSWLKREGPFARLPGGPLVDYSFDRVIPQQVLVGFREWDYRTLVQSGIAVGWVHKPAALIGERYYGKGKAVLNTFHLADEDIGSDPTATALLDALVEQALC